MGEDYLVSQAVKRVCEAAEQIGEITFDQLNALLPAAQFTPGQIERILNRLSEKGIQLVED
jgi:RNA polymerase primary sigma factor